MLFAMCLFLVAACGDEAPAPTYYTNPVPAGPSNDSISRRLQQGMTEDQVVAIAGQPNRVSLSTCGQNSGGRPWQCKVYTYKGATLYENWLTIVFQEVQGVWLVGGWS